MVEPDQPSKGFWTVVVFVVVAADVVVVVDDDDDLGLGVVTTSGLELLAVWYAWSFDVGPLVLATMDFSLWVCSCNGGMMELF